MKIWLPSSRKTTTSAPTDTHDIEDRVLTVLSARRHGKGSGPAGRGTT